MTVFIKDDTVKARKDLPERDIKKGDRGTITKVLRDYKTDAQDVFADFGLGPLFFTLEELDDLEVIAGGRKS